MIIEFSVTNFRSIKNRQTLDFTMNGRVSKKELDENLILPIEKSHGSALLSSAIVFGANASGKSNFLKAIRYFLSMVEESQYNKLDKPIAAYEPFKLDNASKKLPITFEIDFIAKDKKRYIYTVAFSKFKIISEELFYYEAGKKKSIKSLLFSRDSASQVYFGESYRGKKDFALNPNQLLLSKAGVDALPSIVEAYRFFTKYSYYLDAQTAMTESEMLNMAEEILIEDLFGYKDAVVSLIRAADIGISDVLMPNNDESPKKRIKTIHPIYENGVHKGEEVFDLSDESNGTIKLLGVASFIVDALTTGSVIIVDELDKSLHPLLTRMLIQLFHNKATNPNNESSHYS